MKKSLKAIPFIHKLDEDGSMIKDNRFLL